MPKHSLYVSVSAVTLVLAVLGVSMPANPSIAELPSGLFVNEFVASNATGLQDEDGDFPDWIEIRNPTQTSVDLDGVSLTDSQVEPTKWTFPPISIPADGFLVVFASGKDRRDNDGTELHTNFKLNREMEYLALVRDGSPVEILSSFHPAYPEQRTDVSYGHLDSESEYRYLLEPTPGTPNGLTGIEGILPDVSYTPPHGFYEGQVEVALSVGNPTAEIRYTTDGSTPSATTGSVYETPLLLTETTVVRSQAFLDGSFPSNARAQTYLIDVSPEIEFLPVFSLATDEGNLTGPTGIVGMSDPTRIALHPNDGCRRWRDENDNPPTVYYNPTKRGRAWERPVSAEYIDPFGGIGFEAGCGIRVNGSDFTRPRLCTNSKFSYRLYFRDVYGPANLRFQLTERSPVLEHDKIVLRAGLDDRINPFIRDELTRRIWIDMGYPGVQGTFVHLFVNGDYKGYYNPVERPDRQFLQTWFDTDSEWDVVKRDDEAVDGDLVAWNELLSFVIPAFTGTEPGIFAEIEARLDLDNFVDYLLLNLYAATWDWPNNNWVAYRERVPGSRFRFLVWDAEGAWGYDGQDTQYNGFEEDLTRVTGSDREVPRIYNTLVQSATFRQLFSDRVRRHFFGSGAMTEENLMARYDELADQVGPVISNFDNLPNNDVPDLDDDFSIGTLFLPFRRHEFFLQLQAEGFDTSTPTPTATADVTSTPTPTPSPTASSTPTPTLEPPPSPTPSSTKSADLNGDGRVDAKDLLIFVDEM